MELSKSAYLENFNFCGYFLRIKKNLKKVLDYSWKFLVTQGRFFNSNSGNPVNELQTVLFYVIIFTEKYLQINYKVN